MRHGRRRRNEPAAGGRKLRSVYLSDSFYARAMEKAGDDSFSRYVERLILKDLSATRYSNNIGRHDEESE